MHRFTTGVVAAAMAGVSIFTTIPQAFALAGGSSFGTYLSSDNPVGEIVGEFQTHLPENLEEKKQELLHVSELCAEELGNIVAQDSPIAMDYAQRIAAGEFENDFISKNFMGIYGEGFSGMILQMTAEKVDEYIDFRVECPRQPGSINHAAFAVTNDRQYVYLVELKGGRELLSDYEPGSPELLAWQE